MKKIKNFHLDRILATSAFLFSLISLFFAWQANKLLDEQNEITRLANEPNVVFSQMTGSVFVNADVSICDSYKEPTIRLTGTTNISLYNRGARGVALTYFYGSLSDISLPSISIGGWGSNSVTEFIQSTEVIPLPANIPEGTTNEWTYWFDLRYRFDERVEAINTFLNLPENQEAGKFVWTLVFSDGKELEREYSLILRRSSASDIDTPCPVALATN